MSVTEVDMLHQKLDILIEDFQSHKRFVTKVLLGTLIFVSTSAVAVIVELIKNIF